MKKVLILQNKILHYRKPFYNELAAHCDVLVVHSGVKSCTPQDRYSEYIVPLKKIGPFYWQSDILSQVWSFRYDVVVVMADMRWLANVLVFFVRNPRLKFVWWGPWMTKSWVANKMRLFFANRRCATIFYCQEELERFVRLGVNPKKLFVANNTIEVDSQIKAYLNPIKRYVLSVGSLDERKQLDILLRAFSALRGELSDSIRLAIVGDGDQRSMLISLAQELGIGDRVDFLGAITQSETLSLLYREAFVSVSFGQAGLAVLQSLGNGVPYVTKQNAISGGEIFNIKDGVNGLLCENSMDSLKKALLRLCRDEAYARELGKNAFDYYVEHCTISGMVKGFMASLEYAE